MSLWGWKRAVWDLASVLKDSYLFLSQDWSSLLWRHWQSLLYQWSWGRGGVCTNFAAIWLHWNSVTSSAQVQSIGTKVDEFYWFYFHFNKSQSKCAYSVHFFCFFWASPAAGREIVNYLHLCSITTAPQNALKDISFTHKLTRTLQWNQGVIVYLHTLYVHRCNLASYLYSKYSDFTWGTNTGFEMTKCIMF